MAWRDYAIEVEVDYTPPGEPPAVEYEALITIDSDPLQVAVDDEVVVVRTDPEQVTVVDETIVIDTDTIVIDRSVS